MKKITLNLFIILLSSFGFVKAQNFLVFSASLDGAQEVPSVTTNAKGVASLLLNATRDTLCVNVVTTGLSGSITGAHIHGGAAGTTGGVLADLSNGINGNRISYSITGSSATTLLPKLLAGTAYLNIHTSANANGEIRGQIGMETDHLYIAKLDGSQEVPSVSTNSHGIVVLALSQNDSAFAYAGSFSITNSITGVHLHSAPAGQTGGVVFDMSGDVDGHKLNVSSFSNPAAFLTDLKAGNVYINVHTGPNPNGEIRGQLLPANNFSFLGFLEGDREVPTVSTPAFGMMTINFNNTLDTAKYSISIDSLGEKITGAHFHAASIGTNGGVVYAIPSGDIIDSSRITGIIAGADLTSSILTHFINNSIYVNIHTASNPNGEIRDNVDVLWSIGYPFEMSGSQEVPAVSTTANGGGLISGSGIFTHAKILVAYSGLTATGIHLHKNVAGKTGGVIYDLSNLVSNNAYTGYWTDKSSTPLTSQIEAQFLNDSIYVNVHTTANPNGEIRGQITQNSGCFGLTSVANISAEENQFSLYPNPSLGMITLAYTGIANGTTAIRVFDVLGNLVHSETQSSVKGMNKLSINLTSLTAGMYFVELTDGGAKRVEKITIEK